MAEAVRVLPLIPVPPADPPPRTLSERIALVRTPCFWPALPGKPPLSPIERAGLIRLADSIPGICDDETMVAFIEAMRHAPTGDVVELGSGCGRTAAALVWLAGRYRIGAVLCIDDWNADTLADFEIDLAPLSEGRLNHLQADTAPTYGADLVVDTPTFGVTRYEGRIALLHLNGGGPELAFWLPQMASGGWIVFGPGAQPTERSGFVDAYRAGICAEFLAGDTLFVQLKR